MLKFYHHETQARINKEKKKTFVPINYVQGTSVVLSKRSGPFNHRANEASTGIGRKRHSKDACRDNVDAHQLDIQYLPCRLFPLAK